MNNIEKEELIIYTDGACRGNPGLGAWAFVIIGKSRMLECGKSANNTTNNKMELTATIESLKALKISASKYKITLYTDSSYVVNGITKWIKGWIKNNWIKPDKKPVSNKELWIELHQVSSKYNIDFKWVRGHSGNQGNERVDKIANILMDKHIETKKEACFKKKINL